MRSASIAQRLLSLFLCSLLVANGARLGLFNPTNSLLVREHFKVLNQFFANQINQGDLQTGPQHVFLGRLQLLKELKGFKSGQGQGVRWENFAAVKLREHILRIQAGPKGN